VLELHFGVGNAEQGVPRSNNYASRHPTFQAERPSSSN
jgi:hypothetical protein